MNSRRCIFSPPGLEIRLGKALHDILQRSWRSVTSGFGTQRPKPMRQACPQPPEADPVARSMFEDQAGRRAVSKDAPDFIS